MQTALYGKMGKRKEKQGVNGYLERKYKTYFSLKVPIFEG